MVKKSEKSCDKRGQLSLLKLPSVARILSKAKKSVLSVGNKQKINKIFREPTALELKAIEFRAFRERNKTSRSDKKSV